MNPAKDHPQSGNLLPGALPLPVSRGTPTCHQKLCAQLKAEGWSVVGWREAVQKAFRRLPELTGCPDAQEEVDDLLELLAQMPRYVPDAWRIRVEGAEQGWLHPVVVFEIMEVEVSHRVPAHKLDSYVYAFWAMDASEYAHFRAFLMNRFGVVSDLATERTEVEPDPLEVQAVLSSSGFARSPHT